jgi:hypothetical protein
VLGSVAVAVAVVAVAAVVEVAAAVAALHYGLLVMGSGELYI